MELVLLIVAIILGSITYGFINKHTIATRDHLFRSWVFCTLGWFAALCIIFNLV